MRLYEIRRNLGGIRPKRKVHKKRLLDLLIRLQPVNTGWELVRIGPPVGDGGYLIPNDLAGVNGCVSPGVSNMMDFELQLAQEFQIPSYLFDGSIKDVPTKHDLIKFSPKFIGSEINENFISLSTALESIRGDAKELVLQMDIEGHEFGAISSLSKRELGAFRIIVIEFHRLQDWQNQLLFETLIEPVFLALLGSFDVVHVHPNNCDGVFYLGRKRIPRAIEITFHNKSRRKSPPVSCKIPHELDSPNSIEIPDIRLKF
jgi:hypothetical protein